MFPATAITNPSTAAIPHSTNENEQIIPLVQDHSPHTSAAEVPPSQDSDPSPPAFSDQKDSTIADNTSPPSSTATPSLVVLITEFLPFQMQTGHQILMIEEAFQAIVSLWELISSARSAPSKPKSVAQAQKQNTEQLPLHKQKL
ncbi:hypothetical protein PIB30_050928 [Stylosanthes scabra]|uniref:Uncharacterized protein n=1 Tax=Stylosanthes scabra TaxID=79078 RepID=A0ABU6QH99_9FABA|nr:hypothetical protein [Stylosanthes scabra]